MRASTPSSNTCWLGMEGRRVPLGSDRLCARHERHARANGSSAKLLGRNDGGAAWARLIEASFASPHRKSRFLRKTSWLRGTELSKIPLDDGNPMKSRSLTALPSIGALLGTLTMWMAAGARSPEKTGEVQLWLTNFNKSALFEHQTPIQEPTCGKRLCPFHSGLSPGTSTQGSTQVRWSIPEQGRSDDQDHRRQ